MTWKSEKVCGKYFVKDEICHKRAFLKFLIQVLSFTQTSEFSSEKMGKKFNDLKKKKIIRYGKYES